MKPTLRHLLAALLLSSLSACARAESVVDVQVLDLDTYSALPQHPHAGRRYIEGQPGHRYAVAVQNLTGERVLAVLSVDGVNAISGQTAGTSQSGYVLEPWQRLEVRGWRKNLSEVAEFHFTSLGDSYAARTGRPRNVGVIGVAAFRERRPEPVGYSYDYRQPAPPPAPVAKESASGALADAASSAPRAEMRRQALPQAQAQELGTGHGQRRHDPASQTTFERMHSRPNQTLAIYYDSTEALMAKGVLPRYQPWNSTPEAFPIGFAPDP